MGTIGRSRTKSFFSDRKRIIFKDIKRHYPLYILVLPVILYYLIFCYVPIGGITIAFKDFTTSINRTYWESLMQSPWVGFKYFSEFFQSIYFWRIIRNTFYISFATLVFSFPAPIILALLLNEVRCDKYKRVIQTITYMPHFISMVVICGIIKTLVSESGFISGIYAQVFNTARIDLLTKKELFVPIYVLSDIWQSVGWGSIVYLAALSGVDCELYEAATVDGAGRWKQMIHVTLPAIIPTIIIMFILRMGGILNVGYEKILLLYNAITKPTADVISTFVYERGLINRDYSFSTAVGLFNSIVNIVFLMTTNKISKKIFDTALW